MYQNSIFLILSALHGAAIVFLAPALVLPSGAMEYLRQPSLISAVGTVKLDLHVPVDVPMVAFEFVPAGDSAFDIQFGEHRHATGSIEPFLTGRLSGEPIQYITDEWSLTKLKSMAFFHDERLTTPTAELLTRSIDPSHDVCGWADGTDCTIVPIPWLCWVADERTQFSIGISHQQLGEETDLGVIGMLSMEF